jgi:hypothetical protein
MPSQISRFLGLFRVLTAVGIDLAKEAFGNHAERREHPE